MHILNHIKAKSQYYEHGNMNELAYTTYKKKWTHLPDELLPKFGCIFSYNSIEICWLIYEICMCTYNDNVQCLRGYYSH